MSDLRIDYKIADESLVSVTNNIGDAPANSLLKLGLDASNYKAAIGNNSITRMARDYVMQFPEIVSDSIPEDDRQAIAKNFEIQYGQFIAMILNGITGVNTKDVSSTTDLLKAIHNNKDVPNLLRYACDVAGAVGLESKISFDKSDLNGMSYGTGDEVTMESLNDIYLPNTAIEKRFTNALSAMEAASVASDAAKSQALKDEESAAKVELTKRQIAASKADYRAKYGTQNPNKVEQNPYYGATDRKNYVDAINNTQNKVSASDLNRIQNTGDAPTVFSATIYLETSAGQAMDPRTLLYGVKCMERAIPSSVMVPNVSQCVVSNTWAFRFLKWTKGETKFIRDIVFDISNSRDLAKKEIDPTGVGQWFAAIQRRKKNARTFIGSRESLAPIYTLVITDAEAEAIKDATSVDLTRDADAAKMMKDMYLLGFAIYNTATASISIMLDGYSEGRFYDTTLAGLRAGNKTASSVDLKEVNKLLQHGGYLR